MLALLLSFGLAAVPQDPAAECALALLRKDPAGAARATAAVTAPASRSRLQAALLPLEQRPAAMLAVAQAFPADGEADQALLAGSAALLVVLQRGAAAPGLDAWTDAADEGNRYAIDTAALAPVLLGLRSAVAARAAAGGDATILRDARRFLGLATVTRFGLSPARVAIGAAWQRPEGLAEDLRLRALPCPAGQVGWDRIDSLGSPQWEALMPRAGDLRLPPLPAGNWLLEAASAASPWRGVRVVEVSDLDAVALAAGGVLVVGAFDANGPVAAQWQLRDADVELARGSLGAAPSLAAWPRDSAGDRRRTLHFHGAAGSAWLEIDGGELSRWHKQAKWVVHGMVDRPLHRPGETVQGRIVLRSCTWQGDGIDAVPATAIAADQPVRVVADLGSVGTVELPGRTDANGVLAFSFVLPPETQPGAWLRFEVELPERDENGAPMRVAVGELCAPAFFRRPGVQLRTEGPEEVPAGTASTEIAAVVEWASGGPAAGVDVRAVMTVRAGNEREETVVLRTGDDGRATVHVPLAAIGASYVWADFTVTGPDGRVARERHTVKVMDDAARAEEQEAERESLFHRHVQIELGAAVVGSSCRASLVGPANQHGVLVAGRGRNARVQAIRFDAGGHTHADVPVLRADWPRLDVTVATREHDETKTAPVALRAAQEPAIELPARAVPGGDVEVRVGTDAAGTIVTIAVVDERIFELQSDRTPEPNGALRPDAPWWDWGRRWSPPRAEPGSLVASLLRRGRIPPVDGMRDLSRMAGASGGASAGSAAPGGLRDDFRATAAFATVVAGADGAAKLTFTLPSDLTQWRVTAVGIAPDGTSFVATRMLASRQPLAAEPVLPRGVRAGDTFALPIAVDRAGTATSPTDAVGITAALAGAAQLTRAPADVAVPAGRVVRTTTEVHATAPGTAKLSLGAALGEHTDRSQRDLTVGRDAVVRPLQVAALGTGEVAVQMPDGTSPDDGLTVRVLLGGAAAWRQLQQSLSDYPHGCVEQTLSRLLPYFAAARAAKARGEALPAMDVEFRKRLHGGLARLASLQEYAGGFAFWPGGEVDPGMTALALHGLALLRDGGYDPLRSGIRIDAWRAPFHEEIQRVQAQDATVDAAFVIAAELAVAAARFVPEDVNARAACKRLLGLLPQLPAGLCARLGLTLHAAGDADGARACLTRIAAAATPPLAPNAFPGEDPLAVQALHLELATALRADPAAAPTRAAGLLLACLQGRGTTYAHACALTALAMVLPPTPDVNGSVEVHAGAATRTFAIGGEAGDVVQWRVARAADVTVRGPAGVPLLVHVAAERSERASDHAAWQAPLLVERELCTSRADATWEQRRDGSDLEVLAGPPTAGRTIVLRVRVRSPVPMRFVVVECPLPAGFEPSGDARGVDRYDDRIVFTCDLATAEPVVRTIAVTPTVSGRLVWPPIVAAPMYVAGLDGGTTGGFVDVMDGASDALAATATCFTKPPPPAEEHVDPFEAFFTGLDHAMTGEPADDASRRALDTVLANVPAVPDDERWNWLDRLTRSIDDWDPAAIATEEPEGRWRIGALDRLHALLRDATLECLDRMPVTGDEGPADRWWTVARAAERWPHGPARQALLAELLARGRSVDFELSLIGDVEPNATDASLLAQLRVCLTSPDVRVRRAAFAALPPADQAAMPPALVVASQDGTFDAGVIRMLAESEAGRAELWVRVHDPAFVATQRERLDELPAEAWREVPLAAMRPLAIAAATNADDGAATAAAAARVAAGAFANDELQRAMAAAIEPAWRAVLAATLRQRGVTAAGAAVRGDDALWPLWTKALALGEHDAAAALQLLDKLAPHRGSTRLDVEPEWLTAFVLPPLVAAGTPEQLYAARASMPDAAWRAAWDRLDTTARIALVDRFGKRIGTTFFAATAAEADAIWRFLLRGGEADGAVATLARTPAGIACLRRHLTAGEGGDAAPAIRAAVAKELHVDATTLQPLPGETWNALVTRLQLAGFGGDFTPDEAAWLGTLRTLRGVGPASR